MIIPLKSIPILISCGISYSGKTENSLESVWSEASQLSSTKIKKRGDGIYSLNMTLAKYLSGNKFGFFLDLRSMAGTNMHGSGQRLVNSENSVQIALTRTTSGSRNVRCHIFSISDAQLNIMERQLLDIQY